MTLETLTVAPCQYELTGSASISELCDQATTLLSTAGPADVYVFPELFAVDAHDSPEADPADLVLTEADVSELHSWCLETAAERDAVVVGGSYYVDDDGIRNRCPISTPDGTLETYDKAHPIPNERDGGVMSGTTEPPLVDFQGTTISALICYDVEFPSTVRAVVDRGAELIAVPSWTAGTAGFERVSRCSAARAVENQAYVVQSSLVGTHPRDPESTATGRSAVYAPCDDVVGPHGTRLSLPRDEAAAASCALDIAALEESRERASVRPYTDAAEFDQSE